MVRSFDFKRVLAGAIALMALAFTPKVYAQDATPLTPQERKAAEQQRMQELKAKIEAIKYEKLKTTLAMDDETAKKFFTIYKPAEAEMGQIVKQRNEELKKLGQMMNGAKADADVDPELQKIRELNHQIEDRAFKLSDDLKPVLAPRQRAKLLVFEHEFAKKLNEQVVRNKLANGGDRRRMMEMRKLAQERRLLRRLKRLNH